MPPTTLERVATFLQEASRSEDPKYQYACFHEAQKIILYEEKSLLDGFFDEILRFYSHKSQEIRKSIVLFIEAACKQDIEVLPRAINTLGFLVEDESVNVLKVLVLCVISLYRISMTWVVRTRCQNPDALHCFRKLTELKERFLRLLHGPNDGLRMLVMKLMESVVLLQSRRQAQSEIPRGRMETYLTLDQIPDNLFSVLKGRRLEKEAERFIEELSRFVSVAKISSVILHTLINIFCNIARQRPQFMDRAVHGFETIHVNLPPNLGATQVSSLRKGLKASLLLLLKHPASLDFRPQITTLLTDLGATQAEVSRAMPKMEAMVTGFPGTSSMGMNRKRNAIDSEPMGKSATASSSEKRPRDTLGNVAVDIDDALVDLYRNDGSETPFLSFDQRTAGESAGGSSVQSSSQLPSMTSEVDRVAADLFTKLRNDANVTDLVLLTMVSLPSNMPPLFSSSYTPIAAAGTEPQIRHLARLLASQLVTAGLSSMVLGKLATSATGDAGKGGKDADEEDDDDDIQRTFNAQTPAIGALQQQLSNQSIPVAGGGKSAGQVLSNLILQASTQHRPDLTKPPPGVPGAASSSVVAPIVPVSGSSSQVSNIGASSGSIGMPSLFVRPFTLDQVTHTLHREDAMHFSRYSFIRLLNTSPAATTSSHLLPASTAGNANLLQQMPLQLARMRLLTLLPSVFGMELYGLLCDFCMKDLKQNFDILVQLVWQEYVRLQGYQTETRQSLSTQANYDAVLSQLLQRLAMSGVKETYFQRLLLDAPLISSSAMAVLKWACCHGVVGTTATTTTSTGDSQTCTLPLNAAFDSLKELIMLRPKQREEFLCLLLNLCSHPRADVATHALTRTRDLYRMAVKSPEEDAELYRQFQRIIEDFAIERLNLLQEPRPTAEIYPFGTPSLATEWKEDACKPCLVLLTSLLADNPSLLHTLKEAYLKVAPAVKRAILRLLDSSIRTLGMECEQILDLVENCPKGAETLIIRLIHILTEKAMPSPVLVNKVKALYTHRINDVRFLIPVLKGLTKNEIISTLPKLIQLNEKVVKEVIHRLMMWFQEGSSASITPEELLVALHQLEFQTALPHVSKTEMVENAEDSLVITAVDEVNKTVKLKHILHACQLCFSERRIYTQERLSIVINQLMEGNPSQPLPTLFMRTVIQSLAMYPALKGYVLNVLSRCIKRKIWKSPSLWEGFLRCCFKLQPKSYDILLQLPPDVLESVFAKEATIKEQLARYLNNFSNMQRSQVPQQIMALFARPPTPPPTELAASETHAQVDIEPTQSGAESAGDGEQRKSPSVTERPSTSADPVTSGMEAPSTVGQIRRVVNVSKLVADKERLEEEKRKNRNRDKMQKLMSQDLSKFSFTSSSALLPSATDASTAKPQKPPVQNVPEASQSGTEN